MRIGYNRSADPRQYAAVILAAGLSSRMKAFKPLLSVDGRTAIAGLTESIRGAGIEDVLAVTGWGREKLQEPLVRLRVEEAYNADYETGMFSSIQTGLARARELWPEKKAFLLVPVDCPLISIETLTAVMEAADAGAPAAGDCFYVPTFEGKKGHPLLIPASRAEEIIACPGDGGLKAVTDRYPEKMIRVPVSDEGCVLDMDTPESYEELQGFANRGFRREKLSVLSGRKRVIFIRHGETEQHEEPVFIGQIDVPLSDQGRAQAEEAAREVADLLEADVQASAGWVEGISFGREPLPPVEHVYCSDLSRARETGEAIARGIAGRYGSFGLNPEVVPLEDLREISLGEWEGRPVREIREEVPEDYARRGEDLFTFKTGNQSENFYDLQYRAVKVLRRILEEDYGRNIIIVAHSGVIRALENNLKGLRVDDEWEPLEKGGIRIWESPPVR
ncbi:MAG: histidine phosphatase family protein [Firmicutes bacterium]|nr:histidine phosphatase family protein [Bacillota bacterium]